MKFGTDCCKKNTIQESISINFYSFQIKNRQVKSHLVKNRDRDDEPRSQRLNVNKRKDFKRLEQRKIREIELSGNPKGLIEGIM
jgi:hypothetical protein